MANSVAPVGEVCSDSVLGLRCLLLYIMGSNVRQLFAADDIFRCIFFLAL